MAYTTHAVPLSECGWSGTEGNGAVGVAGITSRASTPPDPI